MFRRHLECLGRLKNAVVHHAVVFCRWIMDTRAREPIMMSPPLQWLPVSSSTGSTGWLMSRADICLKRGYVGMYTKIRVSRKGTELRTLLHSD